MKVNVEKVLTEKQVASIVKDETISKSERIKKLFDGGLEVKNISEVMNIRYNFAYNVVSNYIVTNDVKVTREQKESKKDKIIELFNQGKSLKEVSIELKTNYNYVFNVIKELKNKKEVQ